MKSTFHTLQANVYLKVINVSKRLIFTDCLKINENGIKKNRMITDNIQKWRWEGAYVWKITWCSVLSMGIVYTEFLPLD